MISLGPTLTLRTSSADDHFDSSSALEVCAAARFAEAQKSSWASLFVTI